MGRTKGEIVTKSEFARRMDVSAGAIGNAVRRGVIFGDAVSEDGKLVFEVAKKQFTYNKTGRGRKKKSEQRSQRVTAAPVKKVSPGDDWAQKKAVASAKKAEFDALQAELDYRVKSGELMETNMVKAISFQIAKHLTDSLRNLPDRLAQKTYAAYQAGGDEDDTRETMRMEIDTILQTLSTEVKQFDI